MAGKAQLLAVFMALAVAVAASCLCADAQGEPVSVRESLVGFLHALAGGDEQSAGVIGWNASVDPCGWRGVLCDSFQRVVEISLPGLNLSGTVDAALLCAALALRVVTLRRNGLRGELTADISACVGLRKLSLGGNQLSGTLPAALAQLKNLRVLDVSRNDFAGELPPGLNHLSRLDVFLANDNRFSGVIPDFDLTVFVAFNVSDNSLTGPIPRRTGSFGAGSFWPNAAGLCGQPLFAPCTPSPSPQPS